MGPLLWNIYQNDLFHPSRASSLSMYDDDHQLYNAHSNFSYSVLFDYYVSIMRTFSFPARPIVTLVSRALFLFLFCPIATLVSRALFVFPIVQSLRYYLVGLCFLVRLLRKYLVHFLFSCLSNCFVFILCAFCFRSCPIFTVISRALFVFLLVQI